MLDHVSIPVNDLKTSRVLYDAVMAPLGCTCVMEIDQPGFSTIAYGETGGRPVFWLGAGYRDKVVGADGMHLAFIAPNRAAVDAFYNAGIAAGATDNGPPGPRPIYHEHYYGAFLLDLDGHHIEPVCHMPE
jgi:catechol 2,3-dioxygenase-like lactoylglutathione lyase family enzyme